MFSTFLLDSGIIIDALNSKRGRRQLLEQLTDSGGDLACCPINVTEIYAGLRRGQDRAASEESEILPCHVGNRKAGRRTAERMAAAKSHPLPARYDYRGCRVGERPDAGHRQPEGLSNGTIATLPASIGRLYSLNTRLGYPFNQGQHG